MLPARLALLPSLLVAFACSDGSTDTAAVEDDSDTERDSDTEEDFDTEPPGPDRTETSGTCAPATESCDEAVFRVLASYDEYALRSQQPGPYTETLTTAEQWAVWWQENGRGDVLPEVDFEAETVLIGGYYVNASCQVTLDDIRVSDCGGTVRLTTKTTDISGTCSTTCDSEAGALVAVAVATGTTEVCAQVDLTCR